IHDAHDAVDEAETARDQEEEGRIQEGVQRLDDQRGHGCPAGFRAMPGLPAPPRQASGLSTTATSYSCTMERPRRGSSRPTRNPSPYRRAPPRVGMVPENRTTAPEGGSRPLRRPSQ